MSNVNMELPRYNHTHREVFYALKIAKIEYHDGGSATITPAEDGYAPFRVYSNFVYTHRPEVGGYYVVIGDAFPFYLSAGEFEKRFVKETTDEQ